MSNAAITGQQSDPQDALAATWAPRGAPGNEGNHQYMIVVFKPKAATVITPPSGWTQVDRVDAEAGYDGACVLFSSSLGATTNQSQDLSLTFSQATQGAWASVSLNGVLEGTIAETVGTFGTTHTLATKTATADGSMVIGMKGTAENPKNSAPVAPLDLPAVADRSGQNGPSVAIGKADADNTDVVTPTFTSTDYYNNPAHDGDSYQGWTFLFGPTSDNSLSGGGTIPVVGVKTIATSGQATFHQGATADYTVTVTGDDDAPFEGINVSASVTGNASIDSTPKVTNGAGQVVFTLTGTIVGTATLTVTAGDQNDETAYEVTTAPSIPADAVTLTSSLPAIQAGQSTTLIVAATASSIPVSGRDAELTYTLPGEALETENGVTDAGGLFTKVVVPSQVGDIVANATVDAVNAIELTVAVVSTTPINADPNPLTLLYPGATGKVTITRGSAAQTNLPAVSGNTDVVTVSPVTGFDGGIDVTPVAIGITTITVTYVDPTTGANATLSIPVTVLSAVQGGVQAITVSGLFPEIKNGGAPVSIQFVDQNGNGLPDDNTNRLKIRVAKPERITVAHTSDSGRIEVVGTGAGDTIMYIRYTNQEGAIISLELPITVAP